MSERTVGSVARARASAYEARCGRSSGYLLGLALSASIWIVLCLATTITVTSPPVPELPSMALTQHVHESSAHGGPLRAPLFDARFE